MYTVQSSPERKLKLCALPSCKGKRYDLVHKFPMNNERAQQWIDIVDLPELRTMSIDKIRKRFFICSKHFRPQDYKNCESRSLNTTAYPRLHLKVDEDEVPDQCSSSVNSGVEELTFQECTYSEPQSYKILTNPASLDRSEDNTVQYIVCSTPSDIPNVLRKRRDDGTITIQNQVRPQIFEKPSHSYSAAKSTNKIKLLEDSCVVSPLTLANEPNKFVTLKRCLTFSEPVRKKIQLNESELTKTYSILSQINVKGLFLLNYHGNWGVEKQFYLKYF